MHRETSRTACEAPEEEAYRDRLKSEAEEHLDKLNLICDRLEGPPYYRSDPLNLGEFIEARQYLPLINNAAPLLKSFHELLDYAEGTAGERMEFIEQAKAVVSAAEGNT